MEALDQVFLSAGLGCSPVLVDQSAEDSVTSDRGVEGDHGGRVVVGRVLAQALVRTVVIEMVLVLVQDGAGVPFVENQQPIGALVADTADEPFGITVRLWCLGRDLDHLDAVGGEDGIEGGGELGVPVTDEEAKRADPFAEVHQQVTGYLSGPGRSRMSGHTGQMHPAGAHFHDKQDIEPAQCDGVQGEEVGGQQPSGLSAQESSPAGACSPWCRPEAGSSQDAADRTCTQAVSEPGQFAVEAAMAPGRILVCQAQHQVAELVADRWAVRLVGIGPFSGDQAAVPGQQGGGGVTPRCNYCCQRCLLIDVGVWC